MKKIISNTAGALLVLGILALGFISCQKDNDGSPGVKAGDPVLKSINADSLGGGGLIVIDGTGLGDIRQVIFSKDSISAPFYSTLNTETTIQFRVPDVAAGGDQNIILINSAGKKLEVPFKVLAYAKVMSVSEYGNEALVSSIGCNFKANTTIVLRGLNLHDVTKVVLHGTTTEAQILDQTKTTLTIKMPASTVDRAALDITNGTGMITTTMDFVNMSGTGHFIVFDDDLGQGVYGIGQIQQWSWGVSSWASTDAAVSGTKSLRADYSDGGVSLFLGCNWGNPMLTFGGDYYPDNTFAYLSFWAKPIDADVNIEILADGPFSAVSGNGSGNFTVSLNKDKWTYYKIPMFLKGGYSRINLAIRGSSNKTVYFDEMMFVK